jgi:hypothetical protein
MVAGIFLMGVLEFAALSSIMAVVVVITDPQVIETNKAIAGFLHYFPGV